MSDSARISPTAHYTGYVWARNGLSHPELSTAEGRMLYESLRPVMIASRALGGASLEPYLLTRHRAIDVLLERAIDERGAMQVIEVACGLSSRGWRFSERYGEHITYIEADLPEMAARKRDALERMGSLSEHHRVVVLDAVKDDGPESLNLVAAQLDTDQGLAIITEGLIGYLPTDAVKDMWRRFATVMKRFRSGTYVSDLHIGGVQTAQVRAFRLVLAAFVRGQVHLHFDDPSEARAALLAAGFDHAEILRAATIAPDRRGPGAGLAHTLEASTASDQGSL